MKGITFSHRGESPYHGEISPNSGNSTYEENIPKERAYTEGEYQLSDTIRKEQTTL